MCIKLQIMVLRGFAHIISFIFHPLLVMTYITIIFSLTNPEYFNTTHISKNGLFIMQSFLYTFFIPGIGVLMMVMLGFSDSFQMRTRKERVGPLISTAVIYLWLTYNYYKSPAISSAYVVFMLGSTIGILVAFFINTFSKISLHGIGMGGLLGMVVLTMQHFNRVPFPVGTIELSMTSLLMIVILLCGLVGTARLLLNAHRPMDIYGGFIIGLAAQFLAYTILI